MDQARFQAGIELFNRAAFFDAHEVLEDVWRAAPQKERLFLQGLIQVAVAFHHHSTGNLAGAQSLLARGCRNLETYPGDFAGVSLRDFLQAMTAWRDCFAGNASAPALPQIKLKKE